MAEDTLQVVEAARRTAGKFRHGVITSCPSNYGPLKRLGESAVDAFLQTFRQIRRSVADHWRYPCLRRFSDNAELLNAQEFHGSVNEG